MAAPAAATGSPIPGGSGTAPATAAPVTTTTAPVTYAQPAYGQPYGQTFGQPFGMGAGLGFGMGGFGGGAFGLPGNIFAGTIGQPSYVPPIAGTSAGFGFGTTYGQPAYGTTYGAT